MKLYVSRRRRCWTLLVQVNPVIHLSEGHRSDMLLDLSGLTREERIMVQTSIDNERICDRVAEALIIQRPRIHLQESRRRAKDEGKDGFKRADDPNARWFRGKGKGKHIGSGKSRTSAHHANLTSVEDYDYYYDEDVDESTNTYRAHNDPVEPGSDDGEEAPDYDDDEETIRFLHTLLWTTSLFFEAAELDAICSSCRHMGHCSRSRSECATGTGQRTSLPFLRREERERQRQGQISCPSIMF